MSGTVVHLLEYTVVNPDSVFEPQAPNQWGIMCLLVGVVVEVHAPRKVACHLLAFGSFLRLWLV